MSEKRRLLVVFSRVEIATNEAAQEIMDCRNSGIYSKSGLKKMESEVRQQFSEAMTLYSKEAIAIIDNQEERYRSDRIASAKSYLRSDKQVTLMANLEMLKKGFMSETDTEALILVYRKNDSAISAIRQVLIEQNSHLLELLNKIVTADMQYNAFKNMRRIVKTSMNGDILDRAIKMGTVNRGKKITWNTVLFPGCDAIKNDTDDNLLVMNVDSALITIGGNIPASGFKRVTKSVNPVIASDENTKKKSQNGGMTYGTPEQEKKEDESIDETSIQNEVTA